MASGRHLHWSQLRIGLTVTLAIVGVSIAVFFIDEVRAGIEDRYTLYFHTLTTQTLRPHAPVWLAGQRVGQVQRLRFEPPMRAASERLRVDLSIMASAQPYITDGAVAQVISAGLLGQAVVNILPAREPGDPLPEFAELPTAKELDPMQVVDRMEGLIDSVAPVLESWQRVGRELREGEGTLARLAGDPYRLDRWYGYVDHLSAVFDTVRSIAGSFSGVLEDPRARESLERIPSRLEELGRRWNEGGGALGAFARDSALERRLERMAGRISTIEARLEAGSGTAGRLLHDRVLSREMAETKAMIRNLREDLRSSLRDGRPPP